MVRISDILKRLKKEATPEHRPPRVKEEVPEESLTSGVRISPAVMERGRLLNKEESAKI